MTRRHIAVGAFVLACGGAVFACGIDLVGLAIDADASAVDGSLDDDRAHAIEDSSIADASVEAMPKCNFLRVVDPLTELDAGDGGWVVARDVSNGEHPRIDPSVEGPAVSLIAPNATVSVGGIWRPPMMIRAFDVSFRYLITCANPAACADGIAAIWVESRDGGPPELFPSLSGSTFGMPGPGVRGGAVAFDVQSNPTTNDPPTPCVSILTIDPARSPGTYDWHVASTPADAGLLGAHDVGVRVRGGSVSVVVDGKSMLDAAAMTTDFVGWFGISASTGALVGTFVVRDFEGTFYECSEPD